MSRKLLISDANILIGMIVGEMMEAEVVTVDQAAQAYGTMCANGSRLPWNEVDK